MKVAPRLQACFVLLVLGALPPFAFLTSFTAGAATLCGLAGCDPSWGAGARVAGFLAGWLISVGFTLSMAPWIARAAFKTRLIEEPRVLLAVESAFAEAGLDSPEVRWVASRSLGTWNAWVAGIGDPAGGWGPAPVLHLSEGIADRLDAEELRAVLLHEASHLKLGHLKERFPYACFFSLVGLPALVLASLFFGESVTKEQARVALLSGLSWMMVFQWGMAWLSRKQELEADHLATRGLGADPNALGSALSKLSQPGVGRSTLAQRLWSTHPLPEARLKLLVTDVARRSPAFGLLQLFRRSISAKAAAIAVVLAAVLPSAHRLHHEVVMPEILRQSILSRDFDRVAALVARGVDPLRPLPLSPSIPAELVAERLRDQEASARREAGLRSDRTLGSREPGGRELAGGVR